MPKVRIRWTETATYEVEIETNMTPIQLRKWAGDGEGAWFMEVDNAAPDWATKNCVEVNDRELDEIEMVEPVGEISKYAGPLRRRVTNANS